MFGEPSAVHPAQPTQLAKLSHHVLLFTWVSNTHTHMVTWFYVYLEYQIVFDFVDAKILRNMKRKYRHI